MAQGLKLDEKKVGLSLGAAQDLHITDNFDRFLTMQYTLVLAFLGILNGSKLWFCNDQNRHKGCRGNLVRPNKN